MRWGSHNSTFGPHHLWDSSPWMCHFTLHSPFHSSLITPGAILTLHCKHSQAAARGRERLFLWDSALSTEQYFCHPNPSPGCRDSTFLVFQATFPEGYHGKAQCTPSPPGSLIFSQFNVPNTANEQVGHWSSLEWLPWHKQTTFRAAQCNFGCAAGNKEHGPYS